MKKMIATHARMKLSSKNAAARNAIKAALAPAPEALNVVVLTLVDLADHAHTCGAQHQERRESYEALLREKFKVEVVSPGCEARLDLDPGRKMKCGQVRPVVQNITIGALTEQRSVTKHGQSRRP